MHTEKAAIEAKRLVKLYSYEILDTAPDASFDRITRLAQATLQTPIATISLIDANRQWIKSAKGTGPSGGPSIRVVLLACNRIE